MATEQQQQVLALLCCFCCRGICFKKILELDQEWGLSGVKICQLKPSEEEFRLGLRSGIILCNVLNKVQPGAVPKVVEGPGVSVEVPDGGRFISISVLRKCEKLPGSY
ncbi:hypothetical protein NC651_029452 [Populus alba x Populus x berolinensis]|nr:hypothetical protein NC651_029452 [Populus alba x Populus x berolinensis]